MSYAKALIAHEIAVGGFLERHGIDAAEAQRGHLWSNSEK